MSNRFEGPRWPTGLQTLLLRAALLDREPALAAWEEWSHSATLDEDVDHASFQLAPLLYRNLERHASGHPDIGRLKGMYRRTWYMNLQKLHRSRGAFNALADAGVPTMALKGIALLVRHYQDYGVRPMHDIDLLVPFSEAHRAAGVLEDAGWQPILARGDTIDWPVRARHASSFLDAAGNELDLHWHMLEESCRPNDDDRLWAAAQPLSFEGIETHAPAPAHLLLNVLVHGARYAPEASMRWLADAYAIVRTSDVDWEALAEEASRRRVTLPVLDALRFLRTKLQLPAPRDTLAQLARARPTALEQLDYRAQGASPTVAWALTRDLTRYLRLSAAWPLHRRVINAPHYFREHYEADSVWALPPEGARRIYRRSKDAGFRIWRPILPR